MYYYLVVNLAFSYITTNWIYPSTLTVACIPDEYSVKALIWSAHNIDLTWYMLDTNFAVLERVSRKWVHSVQRSKRNAYPSSWNNVPSRRRRKSQRRKDSSILRSSFIPFTFYAIGVCTIAWSNETSGRWLFVVWSSRLHTALCRVFQYRVWHSLSQ